MRDASSSWGLPTPSACGPRPPCSTTNKTDTMFCPVPRTCAMQLHANTATLAVVVVQFDPVDQGNDTRLISHFICHIATSCAVRPSACSGSQQSTCISTCAAAPALPLATCSRSRNMPLRALFIRHYGLSNALQAQCACPAHCPACAPKRSPPSCSQPPPIPSHMPPYFRHTTPLHRCPAQRMRGPSCVCGAARCSTPFLLLACFSTMRARPLQLGRSGNTP